MTEFAGRVGVVRRGEQAGYFVSIERDPSDTGWHIWLLRDDPRRSRPSSHGWDIWADDDEQVLSWIEDLDIEWLS
jgi:hypothetical protein